MIPTPVPTGPALRAAALAIFLTLAAPSARAADDAAIGYVKNVSGAAEIIHAGQSQAMAPGAALYVDDIVATDVDGSFGISLKDNTRISAGPNTRLQMKAFTFEPAEGRMSSIIEMVRGTILYISGTIAKLAPEAARIETPRGTIGVRGTRFLVRVGE
jgi:hypothetical protein